MKKMLLLISLILASIVLVACGGSGESNGDENGGSTAEGEVVQIDLAHAIAESDLTPHHGYARIFKEIIEEESNGEIEVTIHPNGVLGAERDLIEGAEIGTIDAIISSTSPLGNFADLPRVLELPYLFEDTDHFFDALETDFGEELNASIERDGTLKMLGWFEIGFWGYGNSVRPVTHPDDLEGLTLRAVENDVKQDWEVLVGANPTAMAFTEVFTSLQQGVIDGLGNPIPLFVANNFQEVTTHLSETDHFFQQGFMVMSPAFFDGLSEEHQNLVVESAIQATEDQREWVSDVQEQAFQAAVDNGVEVIRREDVDIEAFRALAEEFNAQYEDEFGDALETIKSLRE
ncbi:TRAP transporter substrate-binding protein DctP [Planococcus salinus]|nr:TRAP transporter substrate-binding protein DctP [Planococcus salinus]